MKRLKVIIEPLGLVKEVDKESCLAKVIKEAGIRLNTMCNLHGTCGRCAIEIISGKSDQPKEKEIYFRKKNNWPQSYRLACLSKVKGNLRIKIPDASLISDVTVLESGIEKKIEVNPAVKRYFLKTELTEIRENISIFDKIKKSLEFPELRADCKVLRDLGSSKREEPDIAAIIYEDKELLRISSTNLPSPLVGLAIDLGTTTLVMEAIDLERGQRLMREISINHQAQFGADVLSRIAHASSGKEKLQELQITIIQDLNSMISKIAKKLALEPEDNIFEAVIAGNSTMNHLLLGIPVTCLGRVPFITVFSSLDPIRAADIGLKISASGKIYLAPNIRSFIGGDISAGLLAADLFESPGPFAFIDLGTNGEIALKKDDRLVVASTAAGPAFEGMSLSCGLPASSGAISRAKWINGELKIKTINDSPPRGICGSGLIDLLAILLRQALIKPNGRIGANKDRIEIVPGIFLTQEDIRQAQLACAAVRAGFRLLLESIDLQPRHLEAIYLAGAFGQELSPENCIEIGLIPQIDKERVFFLGNTSLAGARILLLNSKARERLNSFLEKIEFVSLAEEKKFQRYFLESLRFGSWT